MIIHGRTTILTLLRNNIWSVGGVVLLIFAIEVANDYIDLQRPVFSMASLGLMATALSIFLVFRVNEAYQRWWEARILWGCLVNSSRSFARQATSLVGQAAEPSIETDTLRQELVYRHLAYINALRLSLRREDDWPSLAPYLGDSELAQLMKSANKPTQLLQEQGQRLADARRDGLLDSFGQLMLDATLSDICNHQGGCERIKTTVFPDRVARFTQIVAWFLAILIPICIIEANNRFDVIDLIVVPVMVLVFIVTERLGAELKNPFENQPNDTAMTALCRTIEIDLRQQLGENQVPEPLQPANGILM